MPDENLKTLLSEIDRLVADAQISTDLDFRASCLEKALSKACVYLKGLKRDISNAVEKLLSSVHFDPSASTIPLREIAFSDPQLGDFRQEEELIKFLRGMKD